MKRVIILLIAIALIVTGCSEYHQINTPSTGLSEVTEATESDAEMEKLKTSEVPEITETEDTESDITEPIITDADEDTSIETKPDSSKPDNENPVEVQESTCTEQPDETECEITEPTSSQEPENTVQSDETETVPEIIEPPAEPVTASISYSPGRVVSLATSKCLSGGMILTTDNLNSLLADGSISQEEYDSYYPYDGLGYYSVFVETDLNKAATTSGRLLGSEEGIADYIAGMLLLEREPYFLIEYSGITELGGQSFYEFRCYR